MSARNRRAQKEARRFEGWTTPLSTEQFGDCLGMTEEQVAVEVEEMVNRGVLDRHPEHPTRYRVAYERLPFLPDAPKSPHRINVATRTARPNGGAR